ncbi:MAG: hypothetical protein N0C81_16040 [Candidatus Thiodiazotropha lotti]|uniref:Uncharacterized protein n=1 Tax=Candidatus Thiodiazotropha lotti TaxID=2792787 RepID=A0A9E4K0H4_9GAMM|nr:hypothetical protein [Candidatus Thiodiazotropha lotti]ODB99092.1 hypothetical protein A3197_13130 [Candidatus Thiodiazotropha endoloripes]MCG7921066.1 hypothetical protein [Candidatus Thiodiazotropha lotti]MCG7929082.1 hypothetical protein [Candidatus Thiodiazotropha lotti]MCG7937371.1 hypothetical protein [Candidatus Thiodiazotropha lotti]
MTTKLIQKDLFKGTQEFELVDDHIDIRIKAPFKKEENLTVMLTVLDPEPVISQSALHFNSRVNGEPLISLFLGKPNTDAFNGFVNAIKQKAFEEFNAFAGLQSTSRSAAANPNVDGAPVDFGEGGEAQLTQNREHIQVERIDETIELLKQHLEMQDIEPLITALERLKADTNSDKSLTGVLHAFNELGSYQGAVLTYAPYVSILLYDDPFSNM